MMKIVDDEARRLRKRTENKLHIPSRDEMRQLLERYFVTSRSI
jgi:hypothetical protein